MKLLTAILCHQPIDHLLVLFHFAASDQVGENAVLEQASAIDRFLALQLFNDAVPVLWEFGHIGILAAGNFSKDGYASPLQRTKDSANRFIEVIGKDSGGPDALGRA